jgi:hypothetical protein
MMVRRGNHTAAEITRFFWAFFSVNLKGQSTDDRPSFHFHIGDPAFERTR